MRLAASGAGWPAPSPAAWAASPDDLAGEGGDVAGVLARIPTGRLVVLGEPGAGKTMLMVRLVLDLLARRSRGGPVPVLVSLSSWNLDFHDLHGWLAAQLTIDYPALAASASPGPGEGTRIQALLAEGFILPILDGLDEIADALRGPAIGLINDSLRPGERIVVTCRSGQYRDAVGLRSGRHAALRAAAAVQLCPLSTATVAAYLRDDAGRPPAAARWDPVLDCLGTPTPVGQALTTPLMVVLARAIYNPRPGERLGDLRDPAELCSPALADRAAVERYLFDAFIPSAYRLRISGRWTAENAESWLIFLAHHLQSSIESTDFAWWQLRGAVPPLVAGLGTATNWTKPSRGLRFGMREFLRSLRSGILYGVVAGSAIGFLIGLGKGLLRGLEIGLGITFLCFILFGIITGIWVGLKGVPDDLEGAASPRKVLANDRRAAFVLSLGVAVMIGLAGGLLIAGLSYYSSASPKAVAAASGLAAVVGVVVGASAGFILSNRETAWSSYVIARWWLALRHRLPWSLMGFLDDAHRRGVLRQAGAVYQFRHIEMQERLAGRPYPRS